MDAITNSQFTRFLAAKAPEKPCPECGTNNWLSSRDPNEAEQITDPALAVGYLLAPGGVHGLPVISLHCSNCGYVKLFVSEAVSEWVRQHG